MPTFTRCRAAGVALGLLLASSALAAQENPPARPLAPPPAASRMDVFVDSLLAQMTLMEKLGQLNQLPGPASPAQLAQVRQGRVGSFLNVTGAADARAAQRVAVEQSRLHIPLLLGYDVIHGLRTIFPVPLAEAASWDTALVRSAAGVAAAEASAAGINWTFAPMVDIARDARWGRIVEGSGEDPYLGSAMAVARVRGFQGASLADTASIMATAKHFAAYGAAEAGRDYNTVDISRRTLREVYLPPFQAAVDAGVGSIMPSFNEIAGVPSHDNRWLLTDLLRGEWGFDGMVISDWGAVGELVSHGVAADSTEAALLGIDAGVDMDMAAQVYVDRLPIVDRQGRLSRQVLDDAVRRVLRAKYRLGLFQDPYRGASVGRERATLLSPANLAVARQDAREAMVLLKNEGGILPLRKDLRSLAVIGPLADDARSMLGPWSGMGRPDDAVSILQGIRRAVPGTRVAYVRGAGVTGSDTSGFAAAAAAARAADAVVLVVGESADMSGEAESRSMIGLPGVQQQLADRILATGKPVVVLLANGRPLAIPELAARAPAILETWFLGVQAGPAVADVLFGDASPSGKLTVTFPRDVGQEPLYYAHKNTGRPPIDTVKWTSKYIDVPWTPLYPFGYGLSYTTFGYGPVRLGSAAIGASDTLLVSADVTNTGRRAGDEIVQLYIRDEVASVTRPVRELRGFQRVSLQPGETRTVTFHLIPDDLAFWAGPGSDLRRVLEPGWFDVWIAPSSAAGQAARFEVKSGMRP